MSNPLDRFACGVTPTVPDEAGTCAGCGDMMLDYEVTQCPTCDAEVHEGCLNQCEKCGRDGCCACLVRDKETLDWICQEDCEKNEIRITLNDCA